jgi:hypothetical protein
LNFASPFFHCAESIRIASRDGELFDFATDSVTSPDITALRGSTAPFINVAITSRASTFVPTAVFPASTVCRRMIGSSHSTQPSAALVPVSAGEETPGPGAF